MNQKILKLIFKDSSSENLAFLSITIGKDKKNTDKNLIETNAWLKKFFSQKDIGFIDNSGIKETYLGKKLLYLSKRDNSALAKNCLG